VSCTIYRPPQSKRTAPKQAWDRVPLLVQGTLRLQRDVEAISPIDDQHRQSKEKKILGDHSKAAIDYHFKTGHRETA
jgi:hypothetical protein